MEYHGIYISQSNTKMGKVPSFSMMPTLTCAGRECLQKCYAARIARRFPVVAQQWSDNTRAGILTIRNSIYSYLLDAAPDYFRWFVGGDLPVGGQAQLFGTIKYLATCFPHIKFWLPTAVRVPNTIDIPENLCVRTSRNGRLDILTPSSYILEHGDIPGPDSYVCPGYCPTCGYKCWDKSVELVAYARH